MTPPSIAANAEASRIYEEAHSHITQALQQLEALGLPREDTAMLLPLSMETRVVVRTNLRHLVDMSHQRLCTRAYWEYRLLMGDIVDALVGYGATDSDAAADSELPSNEWEVLGSFFVPKCEVSGYCDEKKSCGRRPRR